MGAIWYRARAELRQRWRSLFAIAVLLGLGGGAVMAAAAGARRTDSAYPRLLEHTTAAHLVLGQEAMTGPSLTPEEALADPRVTAVKPYRFYLTLIGPPEQCDAGACLVGLAGGRDMGGPIDGMKLVRGRLPDQNDPAEVALTVVGAERLALRIGDSFPLRGVPFGDPSEGVANNFAAFEARAERQPLTMRVVGIVATPGDFPPQVGDETVHARFTRAFYDRYPEPSFGLDGTMALRFVGGPDDIAPFLEDVFPRYPETIPLERAAQDRNVQRSFHLQALALWALAGVAGVTLLLIVAQAVVRDVHLGSDDNDALAAMGLTRGAMWALGLTRAAAIAVAGALVAIPVAVALSPLLPRGFARAAEPSPGVAVDWVVLGAGLAAIVVLVALLAAWPTRRASRLVGSAAPAMPRGRASTPAELAARAGASPPIVAGTRMALETGRGRTAVPVRTTIAGVTLGIIAVAATLSFGASLDHLLATPRLYGVSFDLVVGAETVDFRERAAEVVAMPEVEGVAWGFDVVVFAGGSPLSGVMLDTEHAPLRPPLLEGRGPVPADRLEAVLGATSARRLGVGVGDTFGFQVPDTGQSMEALVVGIGALPTFDDAVALGDGVWFSHAGVSRAIGQELPADKVFIDLASGADPTVTFERMAEVLDAPIDEELWRPQIGTPSDLVSFGNVRRLPLVLAGLVAVIAVALLAHTLHGAIRRRSRDLAVLKTLGFTRAQTRAAVFCQASVLAILAAAAGLPLGLVVGRWLWRAFAHSQGIIAAPVVQPWAMVATGVAVLVLALAMAAMPARAAARMRPAAALRTE